MLRFDAECFMPVLEAMFHLDTSVLDNLHDEIGFLST